MGSACCGRAFGSPTLAPSSRSSCFAVDANYTNYARSVSFRGRQLKKWFPARSTRSCLARRESAGTRRRRRQADASAAAAVDSLWASLNARNAKGASPAPPACFHGVSAVCHHWRCLPSLALLARSPLLSSVCTYSLGVSGSFFCSQSCFAKNCKSERRALLFCSPADHIRGEHPSLRHPGSADPKHHKKMHATVAKSSYDFPEHSEATGTGLPLRLEIVTDH